MNQLAPMYSPPYILTIVSGPNKGESFQIKTHLIHIGRDPSCEIVLSNDGKCSRKHASIETYNGHYIIRNTSDKNKLYVNKQEISEAQLIDGSVIKVGNSEIKFKVEGQSNIQLASNGLQQKPTNNSFDQRPQTAAPPKRPQKKKSKTGYLIFAVIMVFLAYLLTSEESKKKIDDDITTEKDIAEAIDKVQIDTNKIKKEKSQAGENTKEFRLAQGYYLKGFRDYKKGQYERAIKHFNGCLGVFPSHKECSRYIALSRKQHAELIQYHIHLGTQYKNQNQFAACKSAFRNVMYMLKNEQDPRYSEARTNYNYCHENLEGKL